jgi:hypothetical protein
MDRPRPEGFEPNGLFFLEIPEDLQDLGKLATRPLPPPVPLGIRPDGEHGPQKPLVPNDAGRIGIRRISSVWGFHGKALLSDTRVEAPAPRSGLTRIVLDQPAFSRDQLPPVPVGTRHFVIVSLDFGPTYGRFAEWAEAFADLMPIFEFVQENLTQLTGLKLREDLLDHLGPTVTLYHPADTDPETFVVLIGVKHPKALRRSLGSLAERFNHYFRPSGEGLLPPLEARRLPEPAQGYELVSPTGEVAWLDEDTRPTVAFNGAWLVVTPDPDLAVKTLAVADDPDRQWAPTGELTESFALLPESLTFLSVTDPRDSSLPELVTGLPARVQRMATMFSALVGDEEPASALGLLGIPNPGGFRLRFDPERLPNPEDIREPLFPNVLAGSVDEAGLRLLSRDSFPDLDGFGPVKWKLSVSRDSKGKTDLKVSAEMKTSKE